MNRREDAILFELQNTRAASAWTLAKRFDCPEASIRRSIATLRSEGHNISYGDSNPDGSLYRYMSSDNAGA